MSRDKPRPDSIYLDALDKTSAAERSAYLDSACGTDQELRVRVERLLAAQPKVSDFLESPAPGLPVTITAPPVTEGPGTRIGPYKLHEQIGEGGFGVVFMAEQQEPIRRKVAVKIVKPGMDSRQVIARFEAERQALALMDHPNIAKVLDAGQTPSGRPYFVMELVKGLPITEFCDQSRFTAKERLGLFVDVCRAVQHAHQKAIIHRDIKPSNVLVTLQDGTPLVQVIDFGISKALGQQLTDKTLLTGFAQTIGTPLYMSPEQMALSKTDVDTCSDIYSLGVLLYELLTGTTPFEKERLHQANYDEMRRIIREEEPPKPSTRLSTLEKGALSTVCEHRRADPRKLGEQVRGELDWIVMKALEKDRSRRYESASPLPAAGQSGANFVAPQSGGLAGARNLLFGPDGNLYVGNSNEVAAPGDTISSTTNQGVLEYDGSTGAFIKVFTNTTTGDGGFAFDQDGRFYVADDGPGDILRFDSQGNYIDTLVSAGASSASTFLPWSMVFNAQGSLLVTNIGSGGLGSVVQYNSGVTVTLSQASTSPVTVQYATSDGTAVAGTDYTAQTGTVTFAPGQTSRLIPLVTRWNATPPGNDYFNVQLSNPTGATIGNGSASVTIVPPTLPQLTIGSTSAIEGDPTAHYRGAAAWCQTASSFSGPVTIGPDGNIYTIGIQGSYENDTILRYNGATGAFMGIFATGPIANETDIVFHNGYMYVALGNHHNAVLQFNATTGAYIGEFVTPDSGGLSGPSFMNFGPDGNLYVSSANTNQVLEYNGATGAFLRTFVASGSGGLNGVRGIAFDPSGSYLYVVSSGSGQVLKYNAQSGAYVGVAASGLSGPSEVKFGSDGLLYVLNQGANRIERFTESGSYVDDYVPVGSAGLAVGSFMNFGPNGDLYVPSNSSNQIYQFGTENEALFTVTLSAPFAEPVTVSYATADGTAFAGTNYTATSGTLTFAPGVTTQTIRVPLIDSGSQTTALTFTVTLSNPQLATISQSQGTGTIAPSDQAAKFYVVNDATSSLGGTNTDYKYQPSGTQQAPYGLSLNDLAPRGVASNATGTTQWVVDANKNVYVYSPGGTLLGSWSAGGLSSSATLTGIATNGTDIWLVDSSAATVYKYTGAASRLSGSQSAASSFALVSGKGHNISGSSNPQDIVTDGTSFWVVDGSSLKVFKYTLSGSLLGSWSIDPADAHPTGITISPSNVGDIWIVDNGTDKVYQYIGAASRTSGSQNAGATFALAAGNTNPQGIADPPPPRMMLPQASSSLADTPPAPVRAEAGSLGYLTRPLDSALWGQVMSAMPTSGTLFPLLSTRGDWTVALDLSLGRASGLDHADSDVKAQTPASDGHRAATSSPEMLDASILDQVFADMV